LPPERLRAGRASAVLADPPPVRPAAIDGPQIRLLLAGSVQNLRATWSSTFALFPFSSRLEGSTIVNDYGQPLAVRYTINSLLGLTEAARSPAVDFDEQELSALAAAFRARMEERPALPADRGLSTVLGCALDFDRATLRAQVRALGDVLAHSGPATLNMQDVAWILWGAAAARRAGLAEGGDVALRAYQLITSELIDPGTGLPRHSARRYRRNIVSFGALTYFLRAMHEAAAALAEERARDLFDAGVARAIALQGPRGEWPWMIDARSGTAFDFYPVFSVHQDSMAMLFLHPALDRGLPGANEAIARSVAWVFGDNELGQPMFVQEPFFAYRSIERAERAPRARRYARSVRHRLSPSPATPDARRVRLNDECRSYHLGWLLYVWSNRPETLDGGLPPATS
jgi:hypothetical protein